jgi:hypothetical protein
VRLYSGPSVVVTDDRALLAASWIATASASSWTTGTATPAEIIPVTDVGYTVGPITTTGTITATATNRPENSAGLNAITPVRFHMTDFEFGFCRTPARAAVVLDEAEPSRAAIVCPHDG